MKVEWSKIQFFKELISPIHKERIFRGEIKQAEDEVSITSSWKIVVDRNVSEQVLIAADDFKEFLMVCMGTKVSIAREIQKNGQEKIIYFKKSNDIEKSESYNIKIKRNNIVIERADDSGMMYGIFYLEEMMKFRKSPFLKIQNIKRSPVLETRILRSPMAFYYDEELFRIDEAYPDNYLIKLAHQGFNGIWLRGILRELVKIEIFPELGKNSDKLLEKLNILIKRCTKYGIKVYFYFDEPLAFEGNSGFYKKYPYLKGEVSLGSHTYALCTSNKEVKEFLKEGMRYLFLKAEGLGGVILITASEHHTHCYSHVDLMNALQEKEKPSTISCQKCSRRAASEVVAEIITLINSGVKSANPDAKVIAWNWSWSMYEKEPQAGIIKMIPSDVIIMADFERGGKTEIDGFSNLVDEYSLSYVGPSERFKGTAEVSQKTGHKIYAKLQIGVTHEIATVPYFPVHFKLSKKFIRLNKVEGTGAMESWNFGNILSRNTEIGNWFSWKPLPRSINEILNKIAIRDFGEEASKNFVKAWRCFSEATDHYPFDIKLVYWGPMNFGPAYPLFFKKVNRQMPMPWLLPKEVKYNIDFDLMKRVEYGDNLDDYCLPFGQERVIKSFRLLCKEWVKGIMLIKKSLKLVPKELKKNAEEELVVSSAILSQFISTINFTEFTYLRNKYYENKDKKNLERMKIIVREEIKNSLFCKRLALKDNRLGFHGEAFGYMYNPEKIDKKIKIVKKYSFNCFVRSRM